MRKADINRIARAADKIGEAMNILDKVNDDHMTNKEMLQHREIWKDLNFQHIRLQIWAKRLIEGIE